MNTIKKSNFIIKDFNYDTDFLLKFLFNYNFLIKNKNNKLKKKITLFNYFKFFIEKNKLNKINLFYIQDSYEFLKKISKIKFINLLDKENFPSIIESKNYKLLNFNKSNLTLKKKNKINNLFLINKGVSSNILHKYILEKNKNLIKTNNKQAAFSPKQKQLKINLDKYLNKYNFFNNTNLLNTTSLLKTLYSKLKHPGKAKDITSGLQYIETIFESKFKIYNSLIINKGYLINKISYNNYDSINNIFINKILIYNSYNNYNFNFGISNNNQNLLIEPSSIIKGGDVVQFNNYSPQLILNNKFLSLNSKFNLYISTKISFIFIQILTVESLYKQYLSNNINIPLIHFELISKKMTSCVKIQSVGDTTFKLYDILPFNLIHLINLAYEKHNYKISYYKPLILGISKSILASSGFLTAASFQETIRILIKSALENQIDWLVDLKTRVILSDLITTGTGWYRFFNKI